MRRVCLCCAILLFLLAACTGRGNVGPAPLPAHAELDLVPCDLPAVVAPTPPPDVPGESEIDPATGLHVTGQPRLLDLETYRLRVDGRVDRPLALTYDQLRCLPRVSARATLTCPGAFVDEAHWAGVPLRDVLELAGPQQGAEGVRLVGADGYAGLLSMDEVRDPGAFLAYEWEGQPLPILHGFPVRAVLPALIGGSWVKWLVRIEVY